MEAERIFVPPDFYCPISGELMIMPVSDPEGNSYFRYQGLQRRANLVTTRSNVFAIWITVGYFEII